jgi:hypothetical protein
MLELQAHQTGTSAHAIFAKDSGDIGMSGGGGEAKPFRDLLFSCLGQQQFKNLALVRGKNGQQRRRHRFPPTQFRHIARYTHPQSFVRQPAARPGDVDGASILAAIPVLETYPLATRQLRIALNGLAGGGPSLTQTAPFG